MNKFFLFLLCLYIGNLFSETIASTFSDNLQFPLEIKEILNNTAQPSSKRFYDYPIIYLEDFDFNQLKKIKYTQRNIKNFYRALYMHAQFPYVIKLWSEEYPDTKRFLDALKVHFYKNLAPLDFIILDKNNVCRGYITKKLNSNNKNFSLLKGIYEKGSFHYFPLSHQQKEFQILIQQLKQKFLSTNVVYIDLIPENIVFDDDGNFYLIDLESIRTKEELCLLPNKPHIKKITPTEYLNSFINDLNQRTKKIKFSNLNNSYLNLSHKKEN